MHTPILIGIHGVKRAGKDTTADFFTKLATESDPALSVARRGFSDKAKWIFARQFFPEISMADAIAWVDKYKDSGFRFVLESSRSPATHHVDVGFRDAIAQFATDGVRDIMGDDTWVDQLLPLDSTWRWSFNFSQGSAFPRYADVALIHDLRFMNELKRITALRSCNVNSYNVKIRRKDAEDAVIAESAAKGRKVHRSELGLPDKEFDFVIDNSDNNLNVAFGRTQEVWERILDDC